MKNQVWPDLAEDFLELSASLSKEDRCFVVKTLMRAEKHAESIQAAPGFLMDKTLVTVCGKESPEEIWLFFPERKELRKVRVARILTGARNR